MKMVLPTKKNTKKKKRIQKVKVEILYKGLTEFMTLLYK